MRALAEFVMRGRSQAISVAVLGGALPLLNWLSAAVTALVMLRKGPLEGLIVLMWALVPLGITVYYIGNPNPVTALIGTVALAYVLRTTVSWEATFVVAVLISGIGSVIFELTAADVLTAVVEWYLETTSRFAEQIGQPAAMSHESVRISIMAYFAMGQAYAMLVFLILARWWQSLLYNPGGFQKEFHQLRMSPVMSGILVTLILLCSVFSEQLGRWIPVLTVPLIMMALSLIHWMMGYKKLSGHWVAGFYLLLPFMFQLIYPLMASLALMDSWFNLRARIQSKEV